MGAICTIHATIPQEECEAREDEEAKTDTEEEGNECMI